MKNDIVVLKKLGSIPFWRGRNKCIDSLHRIYTQAIDQASHQLVKIDKLSEKKDSLSDKK